MALQAIKYSRGTLELLDQRLLPFQSVYLPVPDAQTAWKHIKDMVVRGAPAIGVTGALALAVELHTNKAAGAAFESVADALAYINSTLDYLVTSRPTAVNLADSAIKLKAVAESAAAQAGATAVSVTNAVITAAEAFLDEDIAANKAMGAHGAAALLSAAAARGRGNRPGGKLRVLTHCNTGSLATAGYGTALGIIRALHEQGKLEHAYCTETRPYNQGARLTAFELVHDGLPATLVCDSATAYLMSTGQVDAVVVGADRVVANGDTANKIGTYMLSIVAGHHNIPFFIAAPTTTLDPRLPDGSHIEIEQRPSEEVTHFKGQRVAVEGIQVWNPSFDVAPAPLIAGIITEKGPIPRDAATATFKVREFMGELGMLQDGPAAAKAADGAKAADAGAFYALDTATVRDYVVANPELLQHVGPASGSGSWEVKEVGDGNINFVYIVTGPAGSLCIKQSLPFVRCVGESWPLTQDRVRIEAEALQDEAEHTPEHVPRVFKYDARMALIAMQYLAPPFAIMRRGIIQGQVFPKFADHISTFLARNLFNTSLFKLDSATYRQRVSQYTNVEMCRLTEQVIFVEPYIAAANNRHTTPQLDGDVAALHADVEAKVAISRLREVFITSAQALLHGDLHTGSMMVTEAETYVIDPEFAYYGPMAFDIAKVIANLLLSLFASHGHEAAAGERAEQRAWLGECVSGVWTQFREKFIALWDEQGAKGDLYPGALVGAEGNGALLKACQSAYMDRLYRDVVAFAGAFIIRRLVGIAHVADMDSIADVDTRAGCERRALRFGRALLVNPEYFRSIDALVSTAAAAAAPK